MTRSDGTPVAAPAAERLDGTLVYAVPFSERHMRDPAYLGWLRDYEVIRTLNLPAYWQPIDEAEAHAYCRRLIASARDAFFALYCRADDAFIGTLRAGHIDRCARVADIGIMIGRRDYWGRGMATDAVAMLARWLVDRLGMRRLTAGAMAINPAMIRVFERLGFRREGCLRQQDPLREGGYCDHILLGCLADELKVPPGAAKVPESPDEGGAVL